MNVQNISSTNTVGYQPRYHTIKQKIFLVPPVASNDSLLSPEQRKNLQDRIDSKLLTRIENIKSSYILAGKLNLPTTYSQRLKGSAEKKMKTYQGLMTPTTTSTLHLSA